MLEAGSVDGPGRAAPARVAVVDDDEWRRFAMAELLDRHPDIEVVEAIDQDEGARWDRQRWEEVTVAVVDVYDDRAPGEVGTDLYSGIDAVEVLADLPVRVVAIMPFSAHPLVQLRLAHARPDATYHRWELRTLGDLVTALLSDGPDRRAVAPAPHVLRSFGAERARPNDAVRAYLASPLAGHLRPGIGHKGLPLSRRQLDRFRRTVAATGFTGTEYLNTGSAAYRSPRWPDVRDYVLRLIGRLDAPATEHDRSWLLSLR